MPPFRWTPSYMDQLERAVRDGLRVAVMRRGTEYIVIAKQLASQDGQDAFDGHLPMTGEQLRFKLSEIEHFELLNR